ncbi:relaxase/mobilization nuclease domain-containing protein [Rurimicrobium arvi]|uniref:MobA/VirD2-like nuclease domain-containing protein n=1 Tax=Rurimicrobium arvi TaxID=2049916 RepID=A0ABP8MXT6_9BACT
MVIRGNTRGNGRQLAYYLLAPGENDHIRILDADGWDEMSEVEFSNLLYDMSVTAELTKSKKGLYHAQINPAIGEDKLMDDAKWFQAADILAKELGLENQRRAIVLHEKKGRIHAHCVWERYDHDKGKMVSDSFSRLAQDRARMEMERILEQEKTPRRNKNRPELKATLTELWQNTKTSKEFMREVDKAGYMLAEGTLRHPFMVVDENGRTYDLVRQLKGVRIKEVRERMRGAKLIHEKQAIEIMRARGEQDKGDTGDKGREKQKADGLGKPSPERQMENKADITKDKRAMEEIAREFAANRKDTFRLEEDQIRYNEAKDTYDGNAGDMTRRADGSAKDAARKFRDNKRDVQDDLTTEQMKVLERERLKQEFREKQKQDKEQKERNRGRDKGRDYEY